MRHCSTHEVPTRNINVIFVYNYDRKRMVDETYKISIHAIVVAGDIRDVYIDRVSDNAITKTTSIKEEL